MRRHRLFVLLVFLSTAGADAQWLNFPTPGVPRTRDGKPNLAAPTPRAADGKPDLSGVWMHEITTVAEVKRLFGNSLDADIKVNGIGMEIGTQHKYGFNILLDFKPEESPMRPEAAEIMRQREAKRTSANPCKDPAGIPYAGLLSEPIKIVQSPRLTMIHMKSTTCVAKSSLTAVDCLRNLTFRPFWATRLGIGSAMPL